jgi:type VI secretion system protein VasJ
LSTDFALLGVNPVPGENPAGADARYEPEYAVVLAEIEKLSFSGQGEAVSWPRIEENAAAILAGKSKDIQVAVYLAAALWHNRGFEGMLAGMRLLSGLLGNFWAAAWPPVKRLRGRSNALDWWRERASEFLQEQANTPVSRALRTDLLESLAALEETIHSLLPDAATLRELASAIQRLPAPPSDDAPSPDRQAPREQSTAPSPDAPRTTPAGSAAATETGNGDAPAGNDPVALRRRFIEAGQEYLEAARRAEPADATLWRLSRLLLWGAITATPAAENGQTPLPPPDMPELARAQRELEAGNALEAAFAAEAFFVTAPLCLDVQAVIDKALSALGPQFAEAAQAVREESARLIARLPGLEKLSFNDGSPFAGPQTVVWLQGLLRPLRSGREDSGDGRGSPAGSPAQHLEEARTLLAQNKLAGALDLLDAAKTDSPAENLLCRTAQLRLLCEAGKGGVALPLAEALLAETAARNLDDWDPRLALEALTAVQGALTLFDAQNTQLRRDVTRRIARLRPSSALD